MPSGVALPSSLPQKPQVEGFQSAAKSNVTAFQPEVGPPKVRRRGTARSFPFSCSFIYTSTQVGTFETYFQSDLADGANRMKWTDPLRGDEVDWRFDPQNPYTIAPHGDTLDWIVTWQVERLP